MYNKPTSGFSVRWLDTNLLPTTTGCCCGGWCFWFGLCRDRLGSNVQQGTGRVGTVTQSLKWQTGIGAPNIDFHVSKGTVLAFATHHAVLLKEMTVNRLGVFARDIFVPVTAERVGTETSAQHDRTNTGRAFVRWHADQAVVVVRNSSFRMRPVLF